MGHLFFVLMLWLPSLLILFSSKTAGYEKFCWAIACLFCSWLGFLAFLIVTSNRPTLRASRIK